MVKHILILLLLFVVLFCPLCIAQTISPFPTPIVQPPPQQPGRLITVTYPNATIIPFTNTYMTDMINTTVTNNTNNINPATDIYIMIKEFRDQLGIFAYLLILGTIAAMFIITSGRPYQPIIILLVGNSLFLFLLPVSWVGTIITMTIFTMTFLVFLILKGRVRA